MKTNVVISIALLSLSAVGCNDEDFLSSEFKEDKQEEIIVVQERDPKLPTKSVSKPIVANEEVLMRSTNENGAVIGNSDALLGYSYSVGNSILGDYKNVGASVINVNKVKEYNAEYICSKALNSFITERFSYSDYNDYESKLSETKKVSTGFSLNLGLFKIGRKKTTENTFNSEITSSNKAVYGELNMLYYNSSFELNPINRKFYARECLSPSFQKSLYSAPIGDLLTYYGEYVLTGYMTGGKAFALFAGKMREDNSSSSVESTMDKAIDVSASWKSDSISGSCSFGKYKGNGSYTAESLGFSSLQTKLWLYGGRPVGMTMDCANNWDDVSLNLDSWVESLSDSDTHTIIDFMENGISPLSEFVLEENFKRRINGTLLELYPKYPIFVTPYIEIARVFERYSSSGDALYDIAAVLTTRQSDKIVLRTGDAANATDAELRSYEDAEVFKQKAMAIAQAKQAFYDLEIRINNSTRLNPAIGTPLCIDLGKIDENSMCVCSNPRTGLHFIYDKSQKIAFSYLVDDLDGDWILDEYGIRDWVESLDTKSISLATIANSYKIIGL